jgi:magnesium chelatase subunit D
MSQLLIFEKITPRELADLGAQIAASLDQKQGFRLGESTVISSYLHRTNFLHPGEIRILVNRDAGQGLLHRESPGQIIHVDIFHEPAVVKHQPLVLVLGEALQTYLDFYREPPGIPEQPGSHDQAEAREQEEIQEQAETREQIQEQAENQQPKIHELVKNQQSEIQELEDTREQAEIAERLATNRIQSYMDRIFLETGTGSGSLTELQANPETAAPGRGKPRKKNHVHLLCDRFAAADLALIPCLVAAVETGLADQGVEIRKVERIIHIERKSRQQAQSYMFGLEPDKYQFWDMATTLSTMLSSPEDVIELLESFMPGLFRRKQSLANLRNKHGPMRDIVIGMANAGLIRRGWFADSLTKEGRELLEFVVQHQRELESQMRKLLRQIPVSSARFQPVRTSNVRSKQKYYNYISKVTAPLKDAWLGNIAVPETIIQSAKSRFFQKRRLPLLTRDDIRVHQQVVTKPVDVCLVIDGSASMAGPKMKAVWQLAEHLLLTSRDRIAVVIFQRRKARVVIPFTRNYTRLKLSLRSSMHPNGLTPLADGIIEALDLIKNRHVRNPLLVLITDGVPTFGKWTLDPRKDALRAAGMVPATRARLVCIGVASNQEFLEELARQAKGSVYIVESLESRTTLIEIVRHEKKSLSL